MVSKDLALMLAVRANTCSINYRPNPIQSTDTNVPSGELEDNKATHVTWASKTYCLKIS